MLKAITMILDTGCMMLDEIQTAYTYSILLALGAKSLNKVMDELP